MKKRKTNTKNRIIIYSIGILIIFGYVLMMDNSSFTDKDTSVEQCSILPKPLEVSLDDGLLMLGLNSKIYYNHPDLLQVAANLSRDIYRITGNSIPISNKKDKYADIQIHLSENLEPSEYSFSIKKNIKLKAGDINAAHMASVSLSQVCIKHLNKISFPKIEVRDKPTKEYRGLLLDVARQWHSISDIKQIIEVCRWYKINYLQLHLTDDQSFTFPSKNFPDLATPGRSYSAKELKGLVKFASDHGVTIIPELDIPGHSGLMRKVEPFGLEGTHVINMLDENVYDALDLLIGEMTEVFSTSPYFHIGADECWMEGVGESPMEKEFMAAHNLENHEDIYNYFIVRMNEIVKKHDKKTLVWEGFKEKGSENIPIPNDITVFAWESLYQRPDSLLANGYTTINASWQPLYIVPHRSWDPEYIYNWNISRFENWWEITPAYNPIQVEPTDQIIGAQMCAWENMPQYDLPAVMWRLPAMSERIWVPEMNSGDYADYKFRYEIQDIKLRRVLYPFDINIEGLNFPGFMGTDQHKPFQFDKQIWVGIKPYRDDLSLRYTLNGSRPTIKSQLFTKDISLSESTDLKIQAFNQKGQLVGYTRWYPLEKSE